MRVETATQRRPKGCECSFRQFMVGDGCQYCNPEYAAQFADDYKPVPDAPVPMEMKMSETWRYLPAAGKLHARMVFGDGVAVFKVEPSDYRGHLMAAAPVLLEACITALEAGNEGDWQSARDALSRAIRSVSDA